VAEAIGLRERKKQQTRQAIFEAARRLFAERGFDSVTVAEIARAANVSEVTVFNDFPTKEDLFYGGMQFFEEELLEAVRSRPRGEPAVTALKRKMLESADGLRAKDRIDAIIKAARTVSASPSLVAREREIVERYTLRLAELLAAETGAHAGDVEPLAAAAAMIGAHRALVDHVRSRVLAGKRGAALVEDTRTQTRRAFGRLERGLGGYAARKPSSDRAASRPRVTPPRLRGAPPVRGKANARP
jgi:AcrR family transcriptional regulator